MDLELILGLYLGIISRAGTSYNRYQLRYKPADDVAQFFLGDSSSYTIVDSDNDLVLNEWNHLVATWNGTHMYLFVNGIEQSNVSLFTSSPKTTSADLELGRYTEQNYFQGLVDEIRISNKFRDSGWIITEYNNQNNPSGFLEIGPEEGGENNPPTAPDIDGNRHCRVGETYLYEFVSTDPDGDDVYYEINWGDGTNKDWFGPFESGKIVSVTQTWRIMGNFTIWARAKDTEGLISDWGKLNVEVPRNRIFTHIFIKLLFEQFPILTRLLNILK